MQRACSATTNRVRPCHAATPLAAAIALCFCAGSEAATITVNDAGEGSVAGKCTLTDAVAALNTAAPKNACAAGDGNADTISLSFFTTPTTIAFSLPSVGDANSALVLSKPVAIRAGLDAAGNPLVTLMRSSVSGTPGFRLISTASDLSVTGVVLQNGMAADRGGAIYAGDNANVALVDSGVTANSAASSGGGIAANCGNVTLTRSRISGNQAGKNGGGVYAANHANATTLCESTITLHHSSVTGNAASTGSGGGIYSFNGHVYGYYATLDSNSAGGLTGGGIYAYYSISLFACTVSNNSVGNSGGGVAAHGYIGLTNSTVAGNSASQSAVGADAIGIYSSTISANIGAGMYATGGVSFLSAATIVGSIIQGNTGNNLTGEVHAAGSNNIIGPDPSGGSIDYPPGSIDCDAKLGLLADNGGPTRTIALQDGSCAIDAGPLGASVPSDQRGTRFARKVGAATDIGAFEFQSNDRIFFDGFGGP